MVQKRNHRVAAASTRARVRGVEVPVVNLSLGGACLALPGEPPRANLTFELELQHPHLAQAAQVQAQIVWSSARSPNAPAQAGVRWTALAPAERVLVRRCMLAEYGHGVWTPDAPRPIGYVVPVGAEAWGLFDHDLREQGKLRRADGRLLLRAGAADEVQTPSFAQAAARAFGLSAAPRLEPALDEPPRALPSLSGSCVLDDGRPVGYVARAGESWSFFDLQREPLGFMTLAPGGEWRVVALGCNDDGSLDLRRAPSYPDALAAAFSLANPPGLRSTVFQPARLLDEM